MFQRNMVSSSSGSSTLLGMCCPWRWWHHLSLKRWELPTQNIALHPRRLTSPAKLLWEPEMSWKRTPKKSDLCKYLLDSDHSVNSGKDNMALVGIQVRHVM